MNYIKKGINYIKGDEKENAEQGSYKLPKGKFESTKWAECVVTGTDDDRLALNKDGMASIRKHYHDVISLVGPPGVGSFIFYLFRLLF